MTKLTIPAEELLRFGGIEYCMAKKHISSLKDCNVTVTGKPTFIGQIILNEYLGKENNFTSEKAHSFMNQKVIDRINSKENKEFWNKMQNNYCFFSPKGPVFWKTNFDKIKSSLKSKVIMDENISIIKLQTLFQKNYDIEGNLILESGFNVPTDFIENSKKLISAFKELTKDKNAQPCSEKNISVLLYSTKLFHPGSETLFFIQAENGIEFLAPNLNLYLFFPEYETQLIVPYFNYLKNNFFNITKEYSRFVEGTTAADMLKEKEKENYTGPNEITDKSRILMLQKIQAGISPEQIIRDGTKKIAELADTYSLNLNCEKKEESLKIFITLNNNNSYDRSLDFSIPKTALVENYENTMQMLEKEFQKIAASAM